ncbi:MAG: exopolyphosphatase [Alkalimonas sp.]|nr:exopolyphosphatase [Alkalimonas sp.]
MAAVDLGSNSFHLVIARDIDGDLQLLHREKQRVQLAEGLSDDLILSEDAMERGLNVLKQFADTLMDIPADSVRIIATYTLRRAKNSATFLRRARQILPFPIEVISGQEEARYIYQGVAHFEHFEGRRLVMDIGGGSTEFSLGLGAEPLQLSSRNMGCVSYAGQFFHSGKITQRRFQRAIIQAEQELESIAGSFKRMGWQQAVGTSGSVKIIRDLLLHHDPEQQSIRLPALQLLQQRLIAAGHTDQLDWPGLTDDRRQLLSPAVAILIAAFQMLDIDSMHYVDAALREGVLNEMCQRLHNQDIRQQTIQSLQKRYQIDDEQCQRVQSTAQTLFHHVQDTWQLDAEDGRLLDWASQVFEIGLHINSSGIQKHSAYILQHANLPGFNQEQQRLLAAMVRFHRRKLKLEELPKLHLYPQQKVVPLLVLLRLAVLLNQKRRDHWLPEFKVKASNQQLQLKLPADWLLEQPVLIADLQHEQRLLAKVNFELTCPQLPLEEAEL